MMVPVTRLMVMVMVMWRLREGWDGE